MFITKLFLCILVLQICKQVSCRECSDCIEYISCKAAVDHARYKQNDETKQLFSGAFCGRMTRARTPKVCCSDFPPLLTTANVLSRTAEERSDKENLLPEECGHILGDRIFGGTFAKLYEFPWMALISYNTSDGLRFECGGTIINSRYILTAAHCVVNKKIAGVRVGEYDLNTDEDCEVAPDNVICEDHYQDTYVEEIIPHKDYASTTRYINDIALLRVKDTIDFGFRNVAPICLPISAELRNKDVANRNGTVAGWGVTETGSQSTILLKVDVPIKTKSQCKSYYNRDIARNVDKIEKQFCAGELRKDSCSGDSGGPLMLQEDYNNVNRYVQYGIVSYGPYQCGSLFPGVYTDVRMFIDWILKNIRE